MRFDELRHALPDLEELDPLIERALRASRPDPTRAWSGSAELDTVGSRVVDPEVLTRAVEELAEAERQHAAAIYAAVAQAVSRLEAQDRIAAAEALLRASALEEARERPGKAMAYARAAHRAVEGERDRSMTARALRRWARAARRAGDLVEAMRRYREAYEIGSAISDARGSAEAAVGAGNVMEQQGRWEKAAGWYRAAMALLGEEVQAPERWHALLNLHIVLRSMGDLQGSRSLLEEAEGVASAIGDPEARPYFENARGQLEMANGDFARAEGHFREAFLFAPGAYPRVTIRLNLAEALLAQRRVLEATEQARRAEHEALGAALVGKLPEVYRMLGRIAAAGGSDDAFVLFERALQLNRERGLPALEEAVTLQAYAEAERARGEEETARELEVLALDRYRSLGIGTGRSRWADVFGPGETRPAAKQGADPGGDAR